MKKSNLWLIAPFVVCIAVAFVFGVPDIIPYENELLGRLIADTVPRLAIGALLILLMCVRGYGKAFKPKWEGKYLLWSIPCFLVATVNFPFTALISEKAVITHAELLALFILKCIAIAVLEEVFFRALLVPLFSERFDKNRYGLIITVVLTSALFALMHLINLFFGAGAGETFLQVGYTFLIGCMLAVMLIRTKNIWLCIFVHAVFDIGGMIVTDLGQGAFQDLAFWILTAVAGVICLVHCVITLIKLQKDKKRIE